MFDYSNFSEMRWQLDRRNRHLPSRCTKSVVYELDVELNDSYLTVETGPGTEHWNGDPIGPRFPKRSNISINSISRLSTSLELSRHVNVNQSISLKY